MEAAQAASIVMAAACWPVAFCGASRLTVRAAVWLFHGPRVGANGRPTCSRALYREADARAEMDEAFLRSVERAS